MGKIFIDDEIELIRYNKHRIREMIEESKPTKGSVVKERFRLPMPSHKDVLANKKINIKTYGSIMLNSNWGGQFLNTEDRYIYNKYLDEKCKEISKEINVSVKTLKQHIAKLRKCNVNILEPTDVNGHLVYKLNYASLEGNNFVTIDNVALRILCNAYSENALRLYLVLSYACIQVFRDIEREIYHVERIEKKIDQRWLCEKIGISYSNRIVITDCINALERGGFITVKRDYNLSGGIDKKTGEQIVYRKPCYYYCLSDNYLDL